MNQFLGIFPLGEAVSTAILVTNGSGTPVHADSAPTYRVYGPTGVLSSGSLSTYKHTGSVTGATNASPIVITSAGHNLTTGTRVTVASVGGNTAANGTFAVTVVNGNSFSLDSSTGNGAYTSGGTWAVSGLYAFSLTPAGGDGYEAGESYVIVVNSVVSSTTKGELHTFQVA